MLVRAAHLAHMIAHAAGTPDEVCGILVGRRGPRSIVERCVAAQNIHPTPRNHFLLDPPTLLQTDAAARSGGAEIVGFYHSHPRGGSVPSRHDRKNAWAGLITVIISVQPAHSPYLSAWIIDQQGFVQPVSIALLPA